MDNNTNSISPELIKQIEQEADRKDTILWDAANRGYEAGATEYASKAKIIFDKILALENQDYDNEITIGPELINEIKSFLDASK